VATQTVSGGWINEEKKKTSLERRSTLNKQGESGGPTGVVIGVPVLARGKMRSEKARKVGGGLWRELVGARRERLTGCPGGKLMHGAAKSAVRRLEHWCR